MASKKNDDSQGIDQHVPVLPARQMEYMDEKMDGKDSTEYVSDKLDSPYERSSSVEDAYEGQKPGVKYVNGEPVITTGQDVSNFLFDIRDDGDPALTFRSFVLGTVFAGLGAALCQVSVVSPFICSHRQGLSFLYDLS